MKILMIISTANGETMYNALRLANVGLKKGDEVSVFMLGEAVTYESLSTEQFDVAAQVDIFTQQGDFYV